MSPSVIWKDILACTASSSTQGALCFVARSWQDLIAGVIGAAALAITVAVTLTVESRRRRSEIKAFKIALGTEIRQLSHAAVECFNKIDKLLPQEPNLPRKMTRGALSAFSQLPAAVVYPGNADKVGLLGAVTAERIVFFYGQLALIADSVARTALVGPEVFGILDQWQVQNAMLGFLNAADAAERLRELIRSPEWIQLDADFKEAAAKAIAKFEVLFPPTDKPTSPGAAAPSPQA